jgi:transcriptional regulator with XRE-family HTH domain
LGTTRAELGRLVRAHREQRGLSQDEVASQPGIGTNRSVVSFLEQGIRIPKPRLLESICTSVGVPRPYWEPFTNPQSLQRFEFEEVLAELTGREVNLDLLDSPSKLAAEERIHTLLSESFSHIQTHDLFNSILIFYGITPTSFDFFDHYFAPAAFGSLEALLGAVEKYHKDAIRLFSTLKEAYDSLAPSRHLSADLKSLQPTSTTNYTQRTDWNAITEIEDERLPDLGYISAARVSKEAAERQAVKSFLQDLAKEVRRNGPSVLEAVPEKTKRRMDSLLRKFNTNFPHGLFSPLFGPDADELEREAARIAPKTEDELARMSATQEIALRNLAEYLAADYMDVYVATSMRTDADFISVNHLVEALFKHPAIRPFKLRYFNPTQSWIDDRIAKGLVEALMLRRSDITIYMAQKEDTFGKDSEASVALGQGKPVIVYVPKLVVDNLALDTEELSKKTRSELISAMKEQPDLDISDIDDTFDKEALTSRLLTHRLAYTADENLTESVKRHWADFDLYNEASRLPTESLRAAYRAWLDNVIKEDSLVIPVDIRRHIIGILVANAVRFERRAQVFREIHPLALQVILSSGVLNGILVARSVEQCAQVLSCLIENNLRLHLRKDELNYRLIEEVTGSTVRVISRHHLLRNAFEAHRTRKEVST